MNNYELRITQLSYSSIVVFLAKTLNFLSAFVAIILLARLLPPEYFGRYQQCWLLINTVVPVLILGAPQGLNYLLPRKESVAEKALVCWQFFLLIISAGLIFLICLLLFPLVPAKFLNNPNLVPLIKSLAIFVFFLLPSYCLESLLIINLRQWLLLVVSGIYTVFFLLIHLAYYSNLEKLFFLLAILALMKTAYTFFYTFKVYGFPSSVLSATSRLKAILSGLFYLPLLKPLVNYAVTLTVIALLDVLTVQIDKYLILWFYTPPPAVPGGKEEIFALYSLGAIEIPLVGIILAAITAVVMPEFSRLLHSNDKPQVLTLLHRMTERLNLLLTPIFIYLLFSGFVLIPFLFGERYRSAAAIFSIYLFLIPLRVFNNHPLLIAGGWQRFALFGRLIDLGTNIALGLALLPWLGYFAPAVSTVIATYVHKLYQLIILQRFLYISWRQLYPWRKILTFGGIILLLGIIEVLLINLLIKPPLLSVLLSGVLFSISSLYFIHLHQIRNKTQMF